jgi:hypothetical protein
MSGSRRKEAPHMEENWLTCKHIAKNLALLE